MATTTVPLEIRYRPFLTCGLCYDTYNDPRVLDCSHTFCLGCLTSYINSGAIMHSIKIKRAFPCPFCQELVKPPQPDRPVNTWCRQFKVNSEVTELLRQIESERKERQQAEQDTVCQTYVSLNNDLQNLQIGESTLPENIVLPLFVPSAPPAYEESEMPPLSPIAESGEEGATASVEMETTPSVSALTDDILTSNNHQRTLVRYQLLTKFSSILPLDKGNFKIPSHLCLMEGGNTVVVLDYNNKTIKAYHNVHDEVYVDTKTLLMGNKLGAIAINDSQMVVCGGLYEAYTVTVLPELNVDCCFHFGNEYNILVAGVNNTFIGICYRSIFNLNVVVDVMDRKGIVLKNFRQSDEWYFPLDNFVPTSLENKWLRRGSSTLASLNKPECSLCITDNCDSDSSSTTKVLFSEVYDKFGDTSHVDKDTESKPVAIFFNEEDNVCLIDASHQCILTFPLSQTSEAVVIPIVYDDISLTDLTTALLGDDGKLYCLSEKGIVSIFVPMYGSKL